MHYHVYVKAESEGYFKVEAASEDEAKLILAAAIEEDDAIELDYVFTDYGSYELTGEVMPD